MMDSSIIGKVEKAIAYASEKERFVFDSFSVQVNGDHSQYRVTFVEGKWTCECSYFKTRGCCSHTMAMERVLQGMMPKEPEI